MAPRYGPGITRFSTSVSSANLTASPESEAAVVFVIRGNVDRPDEPTTGGPPETSGAPNFTTGGPPPIRRWPVFKTMPPSSGGTLRGDGTTMIVSPGPDACWTWAKVLNGAAALPFPPPAAVALTYHLLW